MQGSVLRDPESELHPGTPVPPAPPSDKRKQGPQKVGFFRFVSGQPLESLLISEKSVTKFPHRGTKIKTTKLSKENLIALD